MAQSKAVILTGPNIVTSRAITEADTGNTVVVAEIPADSFVPPYGVTVYIPEVLAGGTESLDIGDGDDVDGWIDSTDITETSTGTYSGTEANTGAYAVAGKYYSSADTIDAVVSASLSGGTAYVFVMYYDFSDRDLAAS